MILVVIAYLIFTPISFAKTTMVIINNDGAGEGFNDATPVPPIGGNLGTTLGQQRFIAMQFAADIIGQTLYSDIPISISAEFNQLGGNELGGTLGSAGPVGVLESFAGAPIAGTWFPAALANKFGNQDFSHSPEVEAEFNSEVDGAIMLGQDSWYYGLDANPSGNDVDFVTVALHELLHGFGFLSLINSFNGQKYYYSNDIYSLFLYRTNSTPSALSDMTNLQRASALKATDFLFWNNATDPYWHHTNDHDEHNALISIYAPNPLEYGSSTSHFNTSLIPNNLMQPSYEGAQHQLGIATTVLSKVGWGALTDLSISFESPVRDLIPNTPITYQMIISNLGRNHSPKTYFNYTAAANAIIESIQTDAGSCEINTASAPEAVPINTTHTAYTENTKSITVDEVICDLGEVMSTQMRLIHITVRYTSLATINHTATVYGDIVEEHISNNQITLSEKVRDANDSNFFSSSNSTINDDDNIGSSKNPATPSETSGGGSISLLLALLAGWAINQRRVKA